jgi:diketogulonate reductase-like aldo/keto reductase
MQTVTAGGAEIPALGFGTWPMTGERCREAVATALSAGYRHVDTAQMYDNERAVGRAVAESAVPREDVFVVTKLLRENLGADAVRASFADSLDRLGMDRVDLLLIHSPSRSVPTEETMGAMNELQARGLVDHVGVSNFSVDRLRAAMAASETPVLTNQVSYHPYRVRSDLLAFCHEHDVALTAYSPLDKGDVVGDDTLQAIGDRHGKTAAEVALRWLVQQPGVVAIPKASNERHIRENAAVFDFELSDDEMARVFELSGGLERRLRELLGL